MLKIITKEEYWNLLSDVIKLSMQVSCETDADVFIDFAGHVDQLGIRYHKEGWKKDNMGESLFHSYIYNNDDIPFEGEIIENIYLHDGKRPIDIDMEKLQQIKDKFILLLQEVSQ